jgi:hypothetical protein
MQVRTVFLLLVIAVIGTFAALNWNAILAPTSLSLGIAQIEAPLGLILLGQMVFLAALFLIFVIYLQGTVLVDARRHAKELQANRELADQAEASRFTELREFVDKELQRRAQADADARAAMTARLDQMTLDLRQTMDQSTNTLAAYIGELEDRLQGGGPRPTPHVERLT